MMKFREHALIKRLVETCNFTEKQAETFTDGMIEIAMSCQDQLATKSDIHELDNKIHELDKKIDIKATKLETSLNWIKAIGVACLFLLIRLAFYK
jgi:hypothetical protein